MTEFDELSLGRCRPFSLGRDDSKQGSFAGGLPPIEATPRFEGPRQKFFATIVFKQFAVSIFYSFDVFEDTGGSDIIQCNNQVIFSCELIHAVLHSGSSRSTKSTIGSDMSSHCISIAEWRADHEDDETDGVPHGGSKIGGRPYIDNENVAGPGIQKLTDLGYRQLLQFETPDPISEDFVEGFPWDPGWLHVFVAGRSFDELEFAFLIQQ